MFSSRYSGQENFCRRKPDSSIVRFWPSMLSDLKVHIVQYAGQKNTDSMALIFDLTVHLVQHDNFLVSKSSPKQAWIIKINLWFPKSFGKMVATKKIRYDFLYCVSENFRQHSNGRVTSKLKLWYHHVNWSEIRTYCPLYTSQSHSMLA